MIKLLQFEFFKRWKSYRNVFLGIVFLMALLIPLIGLFHCVNANGTPLIISAVLYSLCCFVLIFVPPIENIVRFDRDIAGKAAPLELSIPEPAWKKVLAKLIVTLAVLLASVLICAVSAFLLAYAVEGGNMFSDIAQGFNEIIKDHVAAEMIVGFFATLFSIVFLICLLFFCIAVTRSIAHRNKSALLIGIAVFIATIIAITFLSWAGDKFPIVKFRFYDATLSLSSLIIQFLSMVSMFLGTSLLLEKKVEV